MPIHLVWFRADLRIHDNLALAAACRSKNARVLALYLATPGQWQRHHMAPRQAAYLHTHLNNLRQQLADKGIPLLYAEVDDFAAQAKKVAEICADHEVTDLFYNYQYEVNEQQRDRQLEKSLQQVTFQGFDDSVILPPGSVMTGNHEMYKVFTPFKNAWLRRLKEGLEDELAPHTLLEVTGSGNTFTVANVIADLHRPTMVLAPNNTLAAQLYCEMEEFFPDNADDVFVSYLAYHQPESSVPGLHPIIVKASARR